MALPGNGIFVVQGEMSTVITAMKRSSRWSSTSHHDEHDSLLKSFQQLKEIINNIDDLRLRDPLTFLDPFLQVIRSEETTGPVTSLALAAVNKFLSYGIIDPTHNSIPACVDSIADAVTHTRFVGTDQASDGVVLMEILQVLRTLMLSPEGAMLTNETVCEIMLSCFRICFEPRLTELLRRTAKHCLRDMVQLLFMRLPQFSDDLQQSFKLKKLKMRAGGIEQNHGKRRSKNIHNKIQNTISSDHIPASDNENGVNTPISSKPQMRHLKSQPLSTTPMTPVGNIVDLQGSISQTPCSHNSPDSANADSLDVQSSVVIRVETPSVSDDQHLPQAELDQGDGMSQSLESVEEDACASQVNTAEETDEALSNLNEQSSAAVSTDRIENKLENIDQNLGSSLENLVITDGDNTGMYGSNGKLSEEYVNQQGVRFTPQSNEAIIPVHPYGLPCIRELFRFLISLCNPLDKQNTELMTHTGLSLLTVIFEVAADSVGKYNVLLALVKDELCKNLFGLLNSERLSIFAADLQVCFLLFESLRCHLKFQLEHYLKKLTDIIISESPKVPFEQKEISLEAIVQLWHVPGLVTELYLNYDCDMYSSNLFEDLTKLLSKNAFPVTAGVYQTHLLSLDALLTIVQAIESNCNMSKTSKVLEVIFTEDMEGSEIKDDASVVENISNFINTEKTGRQKVYSDAPSFEDLSIIKNKKRWLATGTELFNSKPEKGIQFLQEHNILSTELDPLEIAHFLRENPQLDKKMIGEYISKKKNVESRILEVFVGSFDFTDIRIDEALRLYLETFRLPGEAPLIFLVMEHFAEHWHKCNGEPFANTDAAFRLAYAIIMLNMDQHNHNAKRLNIPMTAEDFMKNLRGLNGNADFDQDMLLAVYNSIKNEEIVMPAEQVGLVRENYLWKVLLRRGASADGVFHHIPHNSYDKELFSLIWGPTISALSFVFDKSQDTHIHERAVDGFKKCASIIAHYNLTAECDTLILSLCKFTSLMSISESNEILNISFGQNAKAQLATKTVFYLVHSHGDIIRDGWKNILDIILQLYKAKLLPKVLTEADDFCEPSGKVSLIRETTPAPKSDIGLFSSLYSYIALSSETANQRIPSQEEQEFIRKAKGCIKECSLEQLIIDSKFLQNEALHELINSLMSVSKGPDGHKSLGMSYNEDASVFFLELLIKVFIQNRDRISALWGYARDHLYMLIMGASSCDYPYLLTRAVTGLLRLAICLMRNEEMAPMVLDSLRMLLLLKPTLLFKISRQISTGLFELLKTSAQNIHTESDWDVIFALLECVGAGAIPPKIGEEQTLEQGAKSDGAVSSEDDNAVPDRGYTSDSELSRSVRQSPESPRHDNWILINKDNGQTAADGSAPISEPPPELRLLPHSPEALVKCWECLAFIVRDVAHITPYNFQSCIRCIRTFVEATLHGNIRRRFSPPGKDARKKKIAARKRGAEERAGGGGRRADNNGYSEDASDSEDLPEGYQFIAIQLLDLMHTLHTRTAQIFRWWAEEGAEPPIMSLWSHGWKPLLQGIARLCCDNRTQVRSSAINYLHRALLMHDLQMLTATEWENCFYMVLFPLLGELLNPTQVQLLSKSETEESRIRAATIMSKVFLHHLTPLLTLETFIKLWLSILEFIDRYMKSGSDLLYEAVLESLKNMLLVMHSVKVFTCPQGYTHLWTVTWDKINQFLPNLKDEIFKEEIHLNAVQKQETSFNHAAENINSIQDSDVPRKSINQHEEIKDDVGSQNVVNQNPVLSSPLFSHLGQMVSTPIGMSSQYISQPTTSNASHHYQNLYSVPVDNAPSPNLSAEGISGSQIVPNFSFHPNMNTACADIASVNCEATELMTQPMPAAFLDHSKQNICAKGEVHNYLLNLMESNDIYTNNAVIGHTMQNGSLQNSAVDENPPCFDVENQLSHPIEPLDSNLNANANLANSNIYLNDVTANKIVGANSDQNIFQSSNYFTQGILMPPGTEFFYGANDKPPI